MGVEASTPPQMVRYAHPPTTHDSENFKPGTIWMVYDNAHVIPNSLWVLFGTQTGIANWLQIYPSSASAATYDADVDVAYPSMGVISLIGGSNMYTAAIPAGGNIVNFNLADNVSIVSTLRIPTMGRGVVTADATGLLTGSNGTNGQVLIGGGAAPAWANITSANANLVVTNGANSILLTSVGGGGGGFGGLIADDATTATPDAAFKVAVKGVGTLTTTSTVVNELEIHLDESFSNGQVIIGGGAGVTPIWADITSTGGSVTITSPALNTINLEAAGIAALTGLTGDTGSAAPVAQLIKIAGILPVVTSAAADTVTISIGSPVADGKVLISSSVGGAQWASLVSTNANLVVTPGHNTITLTATGGGGGGGTTSFTTDSGIVTPDLASNIQIYGMQVPGATNIDNIYTQAVGVAPTKYLQVKLKDALYLPATAGSTTGVIYLGGYDVNASSRFMHAYGTRNTFLGTSAGNFSLATGSAVDNTGIGYQALSGLISGNANTVVGSSAAVGLTSGHENAVLGYGAFSAATSASHSVAIGYQAGGDTTGSYNVSVGYQASAGTTATYNIAMGYQASCSAASTGSIAIGQAAVAFGNNSISIGAVGTAANTINIGTAQTACYIKGIYGATAAGTLVMPVLVNSLGKLVTGGGVTSFLGVQIANLANVLGNGSTYLMGSSSVMSDASPGYDIGANFYTGDGVGTPARFTCPTNGIYDISMSVNLSNIPVVASPVIVRSICYLDIRQYNAANVLLFTYRCINPPILEQQTGGTGLQTAFWFSSLNMAATDYVTFAIALTQAAAAQTIGITGSVSLLSTYVSGIRVATT